MDAMGKAEITPMGGSSLFATPPPKKPRGESTITTPSPTAGKAGEDSIPEAGKGDASAKEELMKMLNEDEMVFKGSPLYLRDNEG